MQADVNTIFLALGGVALLIGGVGIANVTLLSVLERVGEIGLRRALGATRRDIGAQFMVESVVVGLLGGMLGAALGVAVVVGVSAAQEWTPILDLRMVRRRRPRRRRDRPARRALPVAQGRVDRADRGAARGRLTASRPRAGPRTPSTASRPGRAVRAANSSNSCGHPVGQLLEPVGVEPQTEARGPDALRVDHRDLLEERVDEDRGSCPARRGSATTCPVARYGTSRDPRVPRRVGSAARKPRSTSVRTWCRTVAGLRPSRSAISRLVSGSSRQSRRMRMRTVLARARASASASTVAVRLGHGVDPPTVIDISQSVVDAGRA